MIPISLDVVKASLQFMPIETELKNALVKNTEMLIEFRTYLKQKYYISDSKAESMIKDHVGGKFTGNTDEISTIAGDYAKSQGFEKSDGLKLAVHELINFQKSLSGN